MNESLTIGLKDLLDLVEKIETRINSYWNFYMIALFAIGAWIFNPETKINFLQSVALSVALIAFFIANFTVITTNETRLAAVESEIQNISRNSQIQSDKFRNFLLNSSVPNRKKISGILHLSIDIIVIALLFVKVMSSE